MRRPLLRVFFKTVCVCCMWGVVGSAVPGRVLGGERADFPTASDALTGRAMPLVVVDADGDSLSLSVPPRRLVVVGQAPFIALHLLYAFAEGRKMLVGYERKYNIIEQFLPFLDPALDQKTVLGTNPGPEQIAALKPDLVIAKSSNDGPLSRSLAVLGIPMLHLGLENPERFLKDVATLGRVVGNTGRADEIVAYYRSRLDILKAGLSAMPASRCPAVLVIDYNDRTGEASVRVPGRSWIQTIQAELAGGRPVWTENFNAQDGWQIVGFEQIAAWNPNQIFTIVGFNRDKCRVMASLKADTKWRGLSALVHGEFHLFPQDIYGWDTPDPRWILGALWLATKMHPALFAHVDMTAEIRTFFDRLFGLEKAVVDKDILPKVLIDGCP